MADTGAPWNLRYPLPTDLVKDGAEAIEDLADDVAAGLSAVSVVRQVVQTVKTDTFTTSSSTFVEVTGLTCTITPQSVSNKVLVIVSAPLAYSSASGGSPQGQATLFRGTTNLSAPGSPGSRTLGLSTVVGNPSVLTFQFLDAPNTVGATTYSLRVRDGMPSGGTAGTLYVNRSVGDEDSSARLRTVATITAIEVLP
jgi:hypothetical protein